MNKRPCPLCQSVKANPLFSLTPEMIAALNKFYRLEIFKKALAGHENELQYVQCRNCSMIYCPTVWSDEVLSSVYQNVIDHQKSQAKTLRIEKKLTLIREWESILRILAIYGKSDSINLRICDFGCGWGDFLETVTGPGVEAIGLETDIHKAAYAASRGMKVFNGVHEIEKAAPFDVFVMNAVIEHVDSPSEILKLASRTLKPSGILVLSTMDFRPAYIRANRKAIQKKGLPLTMHLNPVEHRSVYDYRSVLNTITRNGFEFIATRVIMEFANIPIPFIRNSRKWITFLNHLEKLSTHFDQYGEKSVTLYARKMKS